MNGNDLAGVGRRLIEHASDVELFGIRRMLRKNRMVASCVRDLSGQVEGRMLDLLEVGLDTLYLVRLERSAPEDQLRAIERLKKLGAAILQESGAFRQPKKRRRPQNRPLTEAQTEAVQVVGECRGNIAQAAKNLGKDRSTVAELYRKGMQKLGRSALKPKTQRLPEDRSGQPSVGSDRRGLRGG